MTWQEYIEATRTTAFYPGAMGQDSRAAADYLSLGLAGEAGEVCDAVKKAIRDDGGQVTEAKRLELIKEMGDVTWYLARICDEMDTEEPNFGCPWDTPRLVDSALELVANAVEVTRSLRVGCGLPEGYWLWHDLDDVSESLDGICRVIGVTVQEVWAANVAKLQDRKARGVLGGSGDDR